MFKGFSQLILPIILMVCVIAVLSGLNPMTGEFTSDRSYLDAKTPPIEVPTVAVVGAVGFFVFFILATHKTAERNGHGGPGNVIWTVLLLGTLGLAIMQVFGGGA